MPKLLLIDGNSIINRAFYGIKSLSTKKGIPTNAIYGFLKILIKLKKEFNPNAIAVAFDVSRTTFRHKKFQDYKGNRKGMPDDLRSQLPIIKEILQLMGISIVEKQLYEADDIIGTLSEACKSQNYDCVISTGDRDSFQLINEHVSVSYASTKETILYDKNKIVETYGILPHQLIDIKALFGDKSDNIPGVKGIGEKTALSLIKEFDNIEYIYDNIESIDIKPKIKTLLEQSKNMAFISKELGTIFKKCPIDTQIDSYLIKELDLQNLYKKLKELEMDSIIDNLEIKKPISPAKKRTIEVITQADPENFISEIKDCEFIDFIVKYENTTIKSIEFNIKNKKIFIFNSEFENIIELILLQNKKIRSYDIKKLYSHLKNKALLDKINFDFDLILAAYLLDPSAKNYEIDNLIEIYVKEENIDVNQEFKSIAYFSDMCDNLYDKINQTQMDYVLKEIEIPLSKVLAKMEKQGFKLDKKGIEEFDEYLSQNIEEVSTKIFELADEEFNINSTQHLSRVLYEKIGLTPLKKTKSGFSTNQETLESLIGKHPIIEKIISYRKLTKLRSTYVVGFLNLIKNERVHSIFRQTETRTGRISSTEPNLQNIPIRTTLGKQIRKFFVSNPEYVLLDADYSQIELRILAHISEDKNMISDFNNGLDIHSATAAKIFGLDLDKVPNDIRSKAKTINFGIIYGISAFSLSKDINVSVAQAQEYIDEYFKTYSGIKKYLDETVQSAIKTGSVKTIFGRSRDIPEIKSSNKNIRMFGERIAMNTPIQGSAADIIKIAMIKVDKRLKETGIDANLILQVHDELIIETNKKCVEQAKEILKQEMENAADLSVKLIADVGVGECWYDAKE